MKNSDDMRRVNRVEREIQMTIAQYLISGFSRALPGLVTVSHVKMPKDLRTAKVYISVLGPEADLQQVLETLTDRAFEIQNFISAQLKLRFCPKLTFFKDETTEHILKVEKIFKELAAKDTKKDPDGES